MSRLFAFFSARLWRPVLTLLSGSVLAQAINLSLLPLLSLLYSSADFGLQGIFVATIHTLLVAANGAYDQAIMLPESEGEARSLLRLSQGIALGVSVLVALGLLLVGPWLWPQLEAAAFLIGWQWLLPLSLLLEGWMQPLRVMLNRWEAYRVLSLSKGVQALGGGGLMLLLGWLDWGFGGLLTGWVAGSALSWGVMGVAYLRRRPLHAPTRSVPWPQVARAYRDFPTRAMGSGWLNAFSRQLPFYLLPGFFGQAVNGYYYMAHRALMLPLSLISRSAGEVFYRQATHSKRAGGRQLAQLTRQVAGQLAALATPILLVVVWLGPWAAAWLLGTEWETAGVYARWLMPWIFLVFITSPLTYLLDIERRLDFQLLYNLALFAVRLGSLLLGGYLLSAQGTVMLYAGLGAVMVAFHLSYLLRLSQRSH